MLSAPLCFTGNVEPFANLTAGLVNPFETLYILFFRNNVIELRRLNPKFKEVCVSVLVGSSYLSRFWKHRRCY